ncbi:tetratricopeptide repeat protein [Bernardetia sp. OM2101]|uniref:tetratricopeptide repeat protein n=1 Tax=Bernardetia sp. OM2101 TaxID=3344876 RepID=UPI0035CEE4C6
MNFNFIKGLVLLTLLIPSYCFAQNAKAPKDSKKVMAKAIIAHDKGDYTKAVEIYESINPSDTNYVTVLSEKALSLMYDKKYEEAIEAVEQAMLLDDGDNQNYLENILASCYDELDQYDKAIELYQGIIERNPFSTSTFYNIAVTYSKKGKTNEAIDACEKAVRLSPTYASAHGLLGNLAIMQGYETRAIMAYTTALLVSQIGSEKAQGYLAVLESISNGTSVVNEGEELQPVLDNTLFSELDAIIESKIALDRKYKAKVKINGAILKQWQVIFEKFNYQPNTDDFYMNYYGKLFQKFIAADQLVILSYFGAATANVPKAVKYITKKKKKRDEFITNAATLLVSERLDQISFPESEYSEDKGKEYTVWYDGGVVVVVGNAKNGNSDFPYGMWRYYYENGQVRSIGMFDKNNKREGNWKFYRKNGKLASIQYFKDGVVDGKVVFYYQDGEQPSEERMYKKDVLNGLLKSYYACGQLSYEVSFKDEKKEGVAKSYYPSGELKQTENFENGDLEGETISYFLTGAKSYITNFKAGERDGKFLSYFDNGKLEEESNFKEGKPEGNSTSYFINGQVKQTRTFKDGEPTGIWQSYDRQGVQTEKTEYITEGKNQLFKQTNYEDGKPQAIFILTKSKGSESYDTALSLEFFDEKGNSIATYKDLDSKKEQKVKYYYIDGNLFREGAFKEGKVNGDWVEYHHTGAKSVEYSYKNGMDVGTKTVYNLLGQKIKEYSYKDDEIDGLYNEFYKNGQVSQTGWYINGELEGEWVDYSPTGKKESSIFYFGGTPFGYKNNYAPDGELDYLTYTYGGVNKFVTSYDNEGKQIFHKPLNVSKKDTFLLKYPNQQIRLQTFNECGESVGKQTFFYGNGQEEIIIPFKGGERDGKAIGYYPDGKLRVEGTYEYGEQHGEWKWYFPNGKLSFVGTYVRGKKDGLFINYFPNGKKETEQYYKAYSDYQDNEAYKLRWYNYAGELLYERNYNKHDEIISFESEGTPLTSVKVKSGENIELEANFKNGKPSVRETYKSGVLNGKRTHYYQNGQAFWEVEFENGINSGEWKQYYPDGNTMEEKQYKFGRLEGSLKRYHPNGKLAEEYTYVNDEKHGEAKIYDKDGKLIRTEIYRGDQLMEVK